MALSEDQTSQIKSIIASAQSSVAAAPESVQAAVAAAATTAAVQTSVPAAPAIPPPVGSTVGALWLILVGGLMAVVVGSAAAICGYALAKSAGPPDVIVTLFTSSLAALIGLFVKSPTQQQ